MNRLALQVELACLWEATAQKPGNVHRYADFADLTYLDLLMSAAALGQSLAATPELGIGERILHAVAATRQVVRTNTNLGIVLLLVPLAAIADDTLPPAEIEAVLAGLTIADARAVFRAIRLAEPGGLGEVTQEDVRHEPTLPLRAIMALAAERDSIARQYVNGYQEVFTIGLPALQAALRHGQSLQDAIVTCYLHLLAAVPDSLIARKWGHAIALETSRRAREVLDAGWPGEDRWRCWLLESWLQVPDQRRNPGTTADLVAACLFAALRRGIITLPLSMPWRAG